MQDYDRDDFTDDLHLVVEISTRFRDESIEASAEAEDAFKLLSEKRIKKMPVTQDGRVVGSLSRRNIIAALDVIEERIKR